MVTLYLNSFLDASHEKLELELEKSLYKKTLSVNYSFRNTTDFVRLLDEAKNGINWYSGGIKKFSSSLSSICSSLIVFFGTTSLLINLSPEVTVILIFSLLLGVLSSYKAQIRDVNFRKRLLPINRRLGYFLDLFKDPNIAKDIRYYQGGDFLFVKSNEFIDTEWNLERKNTSFGNRIRVFIYILNYLTQSFIYLFFSYKKILNIIDTSEFTMAINTGISFYNSIISVVNSILELYKNLHFMQKYVVYDEECSKNIAGGSKQDMNYQSLYNIEFKHVYFKYPHSDNYTIKDMNFVINTNEKVAIVGRNGSGKTTLIRLLCGLYSPISGQILLNGKSIQEYDYNEYISLISTVFQDFTMPSFSVKEVLMNRCEQIIFDVASKVGLDNKIKSLPYGTDTYLGKAYNMEGVSFSGGEFQRLAIARSLVKNSPIILLDEPTSQIDPEFEHDLFEVFFGTIKDKTIVTVSHKMTACLFCDKIIVISDGELSDIGNHSYLIKNNSLYRDLWDTQSKYYK